MPGTYMLKYAAPLSFIFTAIAYLPFWIAIFKDEQKPKSERNPPQKATWLIWMLIDLVIAIAMLLDGVFSVQMWIYVAGAGSIAIYALFRGNPGWTTEDKTILALAGLAIALRPFTNNNVATGVSLFAVAVGSWPMWETLWKDPGAIPRLPWILYFVGGVFGMIDAVQTHGWVLSATFGPGGFLVFQFIFVILGLPIRTKQKVATNSPPQESR